jgi:hypothetical protein
MTQQTDILIPPVRFSRNMHSLSYQIPFRNSLPLNTVKSDSVESFKLAVSVINSPIQMFYHVTNASGVMIAVSNIPSNPTLYLF